MTDYNLHIPLITLEELLVKIKAGHHLKSYLVIVK